MMKNKLIEEKRKDIIRLALNRGAKTIRIFGSVARGEDNDKSDIDFLVSFEEERSLFDLIALKNDLEDLLERPVDVVTENALHWNIREQVMREVVEI
ncbi:nucleotidyltransferase family protein [Geosporobacter ferrireducens]|uniref:Nucleotidyltransferase n=2 Tax=Geosporobacter ferrireducens TaxID=1424294 RepID=A0A1D8GNG7_9FIRM|nr:nucleotidyltransferase family protein [Geosporobacter ferrireducens]AOT72435.1 nucleotidyltransferase [Geosporobacter ferrireducens]MTI56305.1 nucleotidyltransferase family protein [Geosporobacter ferrireducens]